MKCPLSKDEPTMSFAECSKVECAWWYSSQNSQGGDCAIVTLARNVKFISETLEEIDTQRRQS